MKKFTILCDVDGVLADLVTVICDELNLFGKVRTPADIKSHDFSLSLMEAEMKIIREAMRAPGFAYGLPWYDGARAFVNDLRKAPDTELLFVTAAYESSPTWAESRKVWLSEAGVDRRNVLLVSSHFKKQVRGDVLIEDHAGTLADWLEMNPEGQGILIDRPWNQTTSAEYRVCERMWRAYDYEDVTRYIKEIAYLKRDGEQRAAA